MSGEQNRATFFEYYVFWSRWPEPTVSERDDGVYLREMAESRYLQRFLDPLYESAGLGISTSNDQLISGEGLVALERAITEAIDDVRGQPDTWPVVVGHTFEPFQEKLGTPIARHASRLRLLEFLESVMEMVSKARKAGGYVHFGGGG
jgi:hypothetical protein